MSDSCTMIPPAELLGMATAFAVLPPDDRRGVRQVTVEVRYQPDGSKKWAITNDSRSNLARDGEWEYESFSSSRTDDFLERCRWPDAQSAIAFAREHMTRYPSGYKSHD